MRGEAEVDTALGSVAERVMQLDMWICAYLKRRHWYEESRGEMFLTGRPDVSAWKSGFSAVLCAGMRARGQRNMVSGGSVRTLGKKA
jgi:hypothetical protein